MEFLTAGPIHSAWALILLSIILWIAYRAGAASLRLIGIDFVLSSAERAVFCVGCGILLLSSSLFLLGLLGFVSRTAFIAQLMALLLFSWVILGRPRPFAGNSERVIAYARANPYFCLALASVFFLALVQALAPPIGNDALSYHLYHPKEFILRGRIEYLPYTRESLWPYLTEMLFMLGLRLEGTLLPTLFHWMFYPLNTLAIFAFCKRFYDERTAKMAALILVFTPVAFAQAGHAYVDHALAFYVFAALYAFVLYIHNQDIKLACLAGLMAGGAMSVKYLGLGAFFILCALVFINSRAKLRSLAAFTSSAIAVSFFWYLHSWLAIENPVYPFFPTIFHSGIHFDIGEGVGMGKGPIAFLCLPWNMTMHPYAFGGEMMGAIFLAFAPFALLNIKNARRPMLAALIFGVAYTYFLFTQSQHLRFYLSIAPLLSVASAVGLSVLLKDSHRLRRTAIACLSFLFLMHSAIFIYRTRHAWPVILGQQNAEAYLLKYERSFEGYRFFREHLKSNERFFNTAEVRYFYNTTGERMDFDCLPLRSDLISKNLTMEQYLRNKNYDYFWMADGADPEIFKFLEENHYHSVYSYQFTEKPHTYNYQIYGKG